MKRRKRKQKGKSGRGSASLTKYRFFFFSACMHTPPLFAKPGSIVDRRAGFVRKTLWVTQYDDEQMFAAGFYCNQSEGGDGLPKWTETKKSVNNEDIVIWLTFGVTQCVSFANNCNFLFCLSSYLSSQCSHPGRVHFSIINFPSLPRVEDFPVMPVETCGFSLKPCNFFTANPGIDVPSQTKYTNGSVLAFEKDATCQTGCSSKPVEPLKTHHPISETGSCCGSSV